MDFIKMFGSGALTFIIPGVLTQFGYSLKNKDDNSTGFDDAGGNVLIALAPVVPAFLTGNESLIKKTLKAVRDTIDNYLASSPAPPPVV